MRKIRTGGSSNANRSDVSVNGNVSSDAVIAVKIARKTVTPIVGVTVVRTSFVRLL